MIPSLTTFLLVPQCKSFVKLWVFLVLDFQPGTIIQKFYCFVWKPLSRSFHMISYTWWCSLSTMSHKQSKLCHAWVIFEIDNIKQDVKGQLKMLQRSNDLWMCSAGSGEQILKRTPLTTGISQRYSQFKLYA